MWKPRASTSSRRASSRNSASAGGQDEQPCEVNNSTTIGRVSASAGAAPMARQNSSAGNDAARRLVLIVCSDRETAVYRPRGLADDVAAHLASPDLAVVAADGGNRPTLRP